MTTLSIILASLLALFLAFLWLIAKPREIILPRPLAILVRGLYRVALRRRIDAFTVGFWRIYLVKEPSKELMAHETVHMSQAVACIPLFMHSLSRRLLAMAGILVFWAKYTVELIRHGYWDNKYEQEARYEAGQDD